MADPALSDYMRELWVKGGKRVCRKCGKPLYYENDSGAWFSANDSFYTGNNGYYCDLEQLKGHIPTESINA